MNDLLDAMYTAMLNQYRDERCDELYEQIRKELPRTVYMRIEPMINEIVDLAMEKAFRIGYELRIPKQNQ